MDIEKTITWLGHASFFFNDTNGKTIYYIDPFDLHSRNLNKADLVFITHAHPDHCSFEDLKKILKEDTVVIAPPDCLSLIDIENEKFPVSPSQQYTVRNFDFLTLPAYNAKPERLQAHPKTNNWVGYVFTINGRKFYHAGDTDYIPEMETLRAIHIDVAMLPIGGTYTMDATEAAKAANSINAKVTIPMHYKRLLGDKASIAEETFKKLVTNSSVMILKELQ